MQRYFLEADARIAADRFRVAGEDAHHVLRVLRMRQGDRFGIVSQGETYEVEIVDVQEDELIVRVIAQMASFSEPPFAVALLQGLPKGERLDELLMHGTEVGVTQFVIFEGVRSVARWEEKKRAVKLERCQRIVKEAAEQSQRNVVPRVVYAPDLASALRQSAGYLIAPYEAQGQGLPPLKSALRQLNEKRDRLRAEGVRLVIGPEGGLDGTEVQEIQAHEGRLVTLGARILRTETAGVVTVAQLLYELESEG